MQSNPNNAIGVFDSGVGGLTVVRALRAELPGAAKVASFEGAVAPFKPSSFGELLDATLGL